MRKDHVIITEGYSAYSFDDFCAEKGLTQSDLDMIANHLLTMPEPQPKREPLLSDDILTGKSPMPDEVEYRFLPQAKDVRDFYEAKIDDGTLMIVKTTMREMDYDFMDCCMLCKRELSCDDTFCPGCGARIVEQ